MTPLLVFLLACLAVFLGTVEAAFSALMRLSLRLVAERNGRAAMLGRYLDDPLLFFVPVRLLIGLCWVLVVVLLARAVGLDSPQRALTVILSAALLFMVCQQLLPLLIVRRDPERVLEILLPVLRRVRPLGAAAHGVVRPPRRPAARPWHRRRRRGRRGTGRGGRGLLRGGRAGGADRARRAAPDPVDRRVRRHAGARSDDAPARHRRHARGGHARRTAGAASRADVLANPGLQGEPRQHPRVRVREGPDPAHRGGGPCDHLD